MRSSIPLRNYAVLLTKASRTFMIVHIFSDYNTYGQHWIYIAKMESSVGIDEISTDS